MVDEQMLLDYFDELVRLGRELERLTTELNAKGEEIRVFKNKAVDLAAALVKEDYHAS